MSTTLSPHFFAIAAQFGSLIENIQPLGNGLINDTYLVTTDSDSFVLQRINRHVFKQPPQLLNNLLSLHRHFRRKTQSSMPLQIPGVLCTHQRHTYHIDEHGDYWRALDYIADSLSLESLSDLTQAKAVGIALGRFHTLFSDLDPASLHDTLPDFHITPRYLGAYHSAASEAVADEDAFCRDFIVAFAQRASILENAKERGELCLRIIHGDPKLNNFLFDRKAAAVTGIIDLDTVKAGLVHYDIGDCLRSCCHQAAADEFDLAVCKALLTGYLTEVRHFFSKADYRFLYSAIELIPFELGLRFYTDYLQGNRYFKTREPEQNLHRAQGQFRLCEDINAKKGAIEGIIESLVAVPAL